MTHIPLVYDPRDWCGGVAGVLGRGEHAPPGAGAAAGVRDDRGAGPEADQAAGPAGGDLPQPARQLPAPPRGARAARQPQSARGVLQRDCQDRGRRRPQEAGAGPLPTPLVNPPSLPNNWLDFWDLYATNKP
eukprot:6386356-Pyramimonas_sp.AAC.1